MPILIDGNNLMHRLPGGERSRAAVRTLVLEQTRMESVRVVLVFDGPPPDGAPEREELGQVSVRYSGRESADDLIAREVGSAARAADWVVVTDDRQLARRARQRGAEVRSLQQWRRRPRAKPRPVPRAEPKLSSREVEEWEAFFSGEHDSESR